MREVEDTVATNQDKQDKGSKTKHSELKTNDQKIKQETATQSITRCNATNWPDTGM